MIKTAQLRVYLPDVRFPDMPPAGRVRVPVFETDFGLSGESPAEDALVGYWQDRRFLCPRTPRLRMLEGLLAIRHAYRRLGGVRVVPETAAEAARTELEALRREHPDTRAHILTSPWHVPIRWFVPFEPQAKEVVGRDGLLTVRYRSDYPQAVERLDEAVGILAASNLPESITFEVAELRSWLEGFPADAMVELDYGTVGTMFDEYELITDESVAELWEALDAVDAGDVARAGDAYGRIVSRWAAAMAVSSAN